MGNSSSSPHHLVHNDIEATATNRSTKVPNYLQPLKRKQTKKVDSSPTIIHHAPPVKKTAVVDVHAKENYAKQIKTLEIKGNNYDESFNEVLHHQQQSLSNPHSFRWTKGRRFYNDQVRVIQDITYPLPNDQTELDRHRVQFYIFRWAFESRHIVPPMIKQKLFEGIKVLDVGCGPGLWLGHPIIDMAQDFNKSSFEAINICNLVPPSHPINITNNPTTTIDNDHVSPSFQPHFKKPNQDNFKLTLCNIVKEGVLPYHNDTFDYVQQSLAVWVYKKQDWTTILSELKRVTKPGGYIQLMEIDLYIQPLEKQTGSWRDQIIECLEMKRDIEPRVACKIDELLKKTGLVDIETHFVSVPAGSWGLDIGNLWIQNLEAFIEAARPFFTEVMQITDTQFKKEVKRLQDELKSGKVKAFNNVHVAWGRIPTKE